MYKFNVLWYVIVKKVLGLPNICLCLKASSTIVKRGFPVEIKKIGIYIHIYLLQKTEIFSNIFKFQLHVIQYLYYCMFMWSKHLLISWSLQYAQNVKEQIYNIQIQIDSCEYIFFWWDMVHHQVGVNNNEHWK